jgi:hypothetical protein
MSKKNSARDLLELAGKFVEKREGVWDHAQWEKLVQKAADLGFEMNEEAQQGLGELLEIANYFRTHAPEKPEKQKKPKKERKQKEFATFEET